MAPLELDYVKTTGGQLRPVILLVDGNRRMSEREAYTVAADLRPEGFVTVVRWRSPFGWHVKASRPA